MFPALWYVICTRKAGVHSIAWLPSYLRVVQLGVSCFQPVNSISKFVVFISLDDKLFSFWLLQGDSYPFARVKGIFRFETGIKVTEFRDLRANPRCLLESQILSFRVKWSQLISTGVLGSSRKTGVSPTPPLSGRSSNGLSSLGVPFDPYDYAPLPSRILATGAAANFPSVSNLVGDVFNAPVFVPLSQVDSAQVVPHRNAPAQGYPSRASLGSAYVARWVWGRERGSGGLGVFEDEIKRLLGKRWVATGGSLLRTNVNGTTSTVGLGILGGGSGANSGASTPFGHPGGRSTLGNKVFPEEEEDEALELERNGRFVGLSGSANPGVIGSGVYGTSGGGGGAYGESTVRMRTQTGDTHSSTASSGMTPTTALTTPDIGNLSTNGSAGTSSIPTPLTPVVALATSDSEAQIGLAKVAEPDVDAFLTYAAIVPEYYRLEGMLIKGIV